MLYYVDLGTSIAGCNRFRIVVKGTGCHGAMPELGVDPINIAAHIYYIFTRNNMLEKYQLLNQQL